MHVWHNQTSTEYNFKSLEPSQIVVKPYKSLKIFFSFYEANLAIAHSLCTHEHGFS